MGARGSLGGGRVLHAARWSGSQCRNKIFSGGRGSPGNVEWRRSGTIDALKFMSVIEITDFSDRGWKDPGAAAERSRFCCEHLERGDILLLPQFAVISEEDRGFLTKVQQYGSVFVKNISYE